jgi:hypothetical protein
MHALTTRDKQEIEHFAMKIAQQVYEQVKVSLASEGVVEIRYDGPRIWRHAISMTPQWVTSEAPATISVSDLIRSTIPGFFGYLGERERHQRVTTCCGKVINTEGKSNRGV